MDSERLDAGRKLQFYWQAAEYDDRSDLAEDEDEIQDAYDAILDLVPDDPTSLTCLAVFARACALHWLDDAEAAAAGYREAVRLDPYDDIARARVAELAGTELPEPGGLTTQLPYSFHLLEMTHLVAHSGSMNGRVWLLTDPNEVRRAADGYLDQWLKLDGRSLGQDFGVWSHLPGAQDHGSELRPLVHQPSDGPARIDWSQVPLPDLGADRLPATRSASTPNSTSSAPPNTTTKPQSIRKIRQQMADIWREAGRNVGKEVIVIRQPEKAWVGVVSAEHARIAAEHGFIQLNHGKRTNLLRLGRGDGFAIYSPTERRGDKTPLRAFSQLGIVTDTEPYLADEVMNMGAHGNIRPWRRRVDFLTVRPAWLRDVSLQLTQQPNWGYQLRRGLVALPTEDFEALRLAMTSQR